VVTDILGEIAKRRRDRIEKEKGTPPANPPAGEPAAPKKKPLGRLLDLLAPPPATPAPSEAKPAEPAPPPEAKPPK
jgi:hypothetical protein